mmetsp:Transcript_7664/g.22155  ORF Transcript_7664/g.22155 Transcript_7664/m.22155 type:complete len:201 (+) Transcript_7664:773-1375(+)
MFAVGRSWMISRSTLSSARFCSWMRSGDMSMRICLLDCPRIFSVSSAAVAAMSPVSRILRCRFTKAKGNSMYSRSTLPVCVDGDGAGARTDSIPGVSELCSCVMSGTSKGSSSRKLQMSTTSDVTTLLFPAPRVLLPPSRRLRALRQTSRILPFRRWLLPFVARMSAAAFTSLSSPSRSRGSPRLQLTKSCTKSSVCSAQ